MIIFGPLWFVLLMMLLFGIFGGKSKEEKWLEQKQTDNIRSMMAAEQGLTLRQYMRRGALGRGLGWLVALCLILWVWTAVSGHYHSGAVSGDQATSGITSGAVDVPAGGGGEVRVIVQGAPRLVQIAKSRARDAALRRAAGY
jgi:hypothetical protein